VGFVDYPITDPKINMHLIVDKVASSLVGVDPQVRHFKAFKPLLKNKEMYSSLDQVEDKHFDLVIVPEVIEHVGNVQQFLEELDGLSFGDLVITAPDAFLLHKNFSYDHVTEIVSEVVHPDHNCWYSPYTLNNVVRKYTSFDLKEMLYIKNSIAGVYTKGAQ